MPLWRNKSRAFRSVIRYYNGMEHMLDIPKDRKRLNVGMLCTLMGLTLLLLLTVFARPTAHPTHAVQQAETR